MAARNRAAQFAAFLDGEHRRMGDGLVGDAEPIQIGEKLGRRGRHGAVFKAPGLRLQSGKLFGIAWP